MRVSVQCFHFLSLAEQFGMESYGYQDERWAIAAQVKHSSKCAVNELYLTLKLKVNRGRTIYGTQYKYKFHQFY